MVPASSSSTMLCTFSPLTSGSPGSHCCSCEVQAPGRGAPSGQAAGWGEGGEVRGAAGHAVERARSARASRRVPRRAGRPATGLLKPAQPNQRCSPIANTNASASTRRSSPLAASVHVTATARPPSTCTPVTAASCRLPPASCMRRSSALVSSSGCTWRRGAAGGGDGKPAERRLGGRRAAARKQAVAPQHMRCRPPGTCAVLASVPITVACVTESRSTQAGRLPRRRPAAPPPPLRAAGPARTATLCVVQRR